MPAPRPIPVAESASSVIECIRQKRQVSVRTLTVNADAMGLWLTDAINMYKRRAAMSSPRNADKCDPSLKSSPVLAPALVEEVDSLKVRDLKARLKERGLNTAGLKAELRDRLLGFLKEEALAQRVAQKQATKHPLGTTNSPVPSPMKIEEGDGGNELSSSKNIAVQQSTAMESGGQSGSEVLQQSQVQAPAPLTKGFSAGSADNERTKSKHAKSSNSPGFNSPSPSKPVCKQSQVQSAIKIFQAKSNKNLGSSYKITAKPTVAANENESQKQIETNGTSPMAKKTLAAKSHINLADEMACETKRRVLAPSTGANRSNPSATGSLVSSSGKSGNSALKSRSEKEKIEARKARLESIRVASKPLTASKSATASSLSKLRMTNPAKVGQMTSSKGRLVSKMREQALANKLAASKTVGALGLSTQKNHAAVAATPPGSLNKTSPMNSAKSKRAEVLSPMDTYELSDGERPEDSDSESEDEEKSSKRIPVWAQKDKLLPALRKQLESKNTLQDPDEIFGEVETCSLQAIFEGQKLRYVKRTSSGNWTRDRVTVEEKMSYKRTMGYGQEV